MNCHYYYSGRDLNSRSQGIPAVIGQWWGHIHTKGQISVICLWTVRRNWRKLTHAVLFAATMLTFIAETSGFWIRVPISERTNPWIHRVTFYFMNNSIVAAAVFLCNGRDISVTEMIVFITYWRPSQPGWEWPRWRSRTPTGPSSCSSEPREAWGECCSPEDL